VSVVTGGNSGTGFAVAKLLVSLGSSVVLACRNEEKCNSAAKSIQNLYPLKRKLITPMLLDLSDLMSVKAFSREFLKTHKRLDILVNNAGIIAGPGAATAQGLEQSFGAMHIGHFALTKYLLKLLPKPVPGGKGLHEAARVINLSADALFAGNFHPSLMTGSGTGDLMMEITDNCGMTGSVECCPFLACPNTNGYARAKLANAMHTYELQRRVDEYILQHSSNGAGPSKTYRRLVAASLHPGSVSTGIHGFLAAPAMAMFLRSPEQAAHVILHAILDDSFVPGAYIDAMRVSHDLFAYRTNHLHKHTAAFPATRHLPFYTDKTSGDRVTLHSLLWSRQAVIWPAVDPDVNQTGTHQDVLDSRVLYRKDTVAARLWDVSEQVVSEWEAKRPILKSNVLSTKLVL
jgi:NAD(P)-dependent dehydrogenase (short-subunit alcohol dehydrogenase family)